MILSWPARKSVGTHVDQRENVYQQVWRGQNGYQQVRRGGCEARAKSVDKNAERTCVGTGLPTDYARATGVVNFAVVKICPVLYNFVQIWNRKNQQAYQQASARVLGGWVAVCGGLVMANCCC